jgi:hypothetical protein
VKLSRGSVCSCYGAGPPYLKGLCIHVSLASASHAPSHLSVKPSLPCLILAVPSPLSLPNAFSGLPPTGSAVGGPYPVVSRAGLNGYSKLLAKCRLTWLAVCLQCAVLILRYWNQLS